MIEWTGRGLAARNYRNHRACPAFCWHWPLWYRKGDCSTNEDRVAGAANEAAGRMEQGFGRATGDARSQVEGTIRQAAGAVQNLYGQAREAAGEATRSVQERTAPMEEAIRNLIEKRPYTAVAMALAAGWVLGRMSRPGY
jgi:uncharacterized protein YjbJ (UPF0337 family)